MDLHFISTASNFPYGYYLAVLSAIKTQNVDDVNVWATVAPEPGYFDLIKDRVKLVKTSAQGFASLREKSQHFKRAHTKDFITWEILYQQGGIVLDLDTFCLEDISDTLGDKEVATTPYIEHGTVLHPFNSAVVVAEPESIVIKDAMGWASAMLARNDILWGGSGPMAFSAAVQHHYDLVNFLKYGTFGEVLTEIGQIIQPFKEDGVLDPVTKVLHLYASVFREFNEMSPDWIANSKMLFARIVRERLDEDEWNV